MGNLEQSRGRRRRRAVVPAAIAGAGIAVGSVAWACVPANDTQTKVQSCSPPAGSPKPCKTPIGQPKFPDATFVKGPSGSTLSAYVTGAGMQTGVPYDLLFASKTQLAAGNPCFSLASVVIGGPSVGNANGGISFTSGTIPANSPLGLGQICFADRSRAVSDSFPATFKVTL